MKKLLTTFLALSVIYSHAGIGFMTGTYNRESGLEIEYDSDNSNLAPYGGSILIGEQEEVPVICYDVELALKKLNCL